VYLAVNTLSIVARKLKKIEKIELSEIQVLEILSQTANRALHWKGFLVLSDYPIRELYLNAGLFR
jgi:hypothetical protein